MTTTPDTTASFHVTTEHGLDITGYFTESGTGHLQCEDGRSTDEISVQQVPEAVRALETLDGVEGDPRNAEWTSAGWDEGRLAAAVAEWLDNGWQVGPGSFTVDATTWNSNGSGRCYPIDGWGYSSVLAETTWDFGPGGGGGLWAGGSGRYFLVRMGDRYTVFEVSKFGTSDEGDINAANDHDAITRFNDGYPSEAYDDEDE